MNLAHHLLEVLKRQQVSTILTVKNFINFMLGEFRTAQHHQRKVIGIQEDPELQGPYISEAGSGAHLLWRGCARRKPGKGS